MTEKEYNHKMAEVSVAECKSKLALVEISVKEEINRLTAKFNRDIANVKQELEEEKFNLKREEAYLVYMKAEKERGFEA